MDYDRKGEIMKIKFEKANDIQQMIKDIMTILFPQYNTNRIIVLRSYGSTANAYARIWSMPKVWQIALDIKPFYVIEVLSEHFDKLPYNEKEKVIIHELMHIPSTFSGALLPHKFKSKVINERTVSKLYKEYKKIKEDKPWLLQD